jgi:hypothetical protein
MGIVTIVGLLKALVTDEAPPMPRCGLSWEDTAFHIVTAIGFHCLDPAVRAFLEGSVVIVFLVALAHDTEEHVFT